MVSTCSCGEPNPAFIVLTECASLRSSAKLPFGLSILLDGSYLRPSVPQSQPTRAPVLPPQRHVLCECNESARYGSPLRGAGRRTRNRRERHASGLVVSVFPSYGGEPFGPAGRL